MLRLLLLCLLATIVSAAASPADQSPGEDDWSLPAWVRQTPAAGFYSGLHPDAAEIKIVWRDVNPADGIYDWSGVTAQLNALPAGQRVWLRFFASDVRHVPAWAISKHALRSYRYYWPDAPYFDIVDQRESPGDFVGVWETPVQNELRRMLQALAGQPVVTGGRVAFAYIPHAWRWGEFSLKWVPEMIAQGVTPALYLDWFRTMEADYAALFGGDHGKLVYTGDGKPEWVEWNPGRIGWSDGQYDPPYRAWMAAINLANGSNALAQHCLDAGGGARSGFTEVFNRYAHVPGWGTSLSSVGRWRYSVADDAFPLIAEGRAFGTENEDFSYYWQPVATYDRYYYWKMSHLNALRLRMNWIFVDWTNERDYPAMMAWLRLSLGKRPADSPDAWCALRQYVDPEQGATADDIRNFERFLTQRETGSNDRLRPAYRIDYPQAFADTINNGNGQTSAWSHEGLATDRASGADRMSFLVDDACMRGGSRRVLIKVTWLDDSSNGFTVAYDRADGLVGTQTVAGTGNGAWKTSTVTINDAGFANRLPGGADFQLRAGGVAGDLTVRFVRVVRRDPPGDVNQDGVLDASDLTAARGQFGRMGSTITVPGADLNGDARVDATDLGILTRALRP